MGKNCPKCKKPNFFTTPTGGKCTNCGYEMKHPPGPGKGTKCMNCGKYTVFNGKCNSCGAIHK